MKFQKIALLLLVSLFLVACNPQVEQSTDDANVKIVATTTIVENVVSQIGGDRIKLSILLPVGTDPHSFTPSPQDIAKVAEADLIFANGGGLEEFLTPLIESAGANGKVVSVSDGIDFIISDTEDPDHTDEDEAHEPTGADPHTWTDPNNVIVWVQNIERALIELDSQNAAAYQSNADAYLAELEALDTWMSEQVEQVPDENRKLVTDHALFGYFATRYGFEQIGTLIPGYSTLAEPTAQELAAIEDAIRSFGVRAIFVGNTVNPTLAERVADDTGTQLVFVYTGSLSELTGGASTYLDYMRYNTSAFVNALIQNP